MTRGISTRRPACWHPRWGWTSRPGCSPRFRNCCPTSAYSPVTAIQRPDCFLAKTERYYADMVPQVAWRLLMIDAVLAEVQSSRGETAEAERWCRRAESLLLREPDAGILGGRVRRIRGVLEQQRMAEPLTPAERRVLELLPTQLTADQMAARHFLTRNTVKSHMSHIYRKLDVTSRTGAVESARRLGLL